MDRSDLEKVLKSIYEDYVSVKDVHETAYTLNPEYKKFWDNHSEEDKKRLLFGQKANSVSNGVWKYQETMFHLATFGASYGIKKLFQRGKPTREERIKQAVTDSNFTEVMSAVNSLLGFGQ